ncbi:glycosyltransferase family 4 protein [Flavihumibacter sp. R14]|nr:glycosyltransferase family 4 protein [Flavihumibacter soli]
MMNKSKVVFFVLRLLDGGGVTTHCASLATALHAEGYHVIFICGGDESTFKGAEWFENQGFTIFNIGFSKKGTVKNYLKNISSYRRFVSLIYRYKPEIIHCHFRSTAIFAMIARVLTGAKSILTVHLHNMPSTAITRFFLSQFDHYIVISSEIKQELIDLNVDPERITRIYNGVDNARYINAGPDTKKELRLKYGFPPDKLFLIVVARLVKIKSIDTFINGIAELSKASRDRIQCVIVGEGSQMKKLRDLTEDLRLQEIIEFVGYRDPVDYYRLSDVFVLPSMKEGFSMAVVEAMLSGLVILRTPTSGCYDQVIDNENGFIFPFYDHKALAEKIEFLNANPAKVKSMQDVSNSLAESRFTLKVMTERTVEIYERLISRVDVGQVAVEEEIEVS